MELHEFWQEIQNEVCVKCIEGDGKGACRLPANHECPIQAFLPQIVMTISNVRSESYDSYVNAFRRNVCILCDWQTSDAACQKRNESTCVLDEYYPALVKIVKTVRDDLAGANLVSDGIEHGAG